MRNTTMHTNRNRIAFAVLLTAGAIAIAALAPGAARGADGAPADLSGTWKIDRKASDQPGKYGYGGGERPDGPPPGDMKKPPGGHGGGKGGKDGDRPNPRRLGPYLRIEQSATGITVADTSGAITRRIEIGGTAKPSMSEDGTLVVAGAWKGGTLEVQATGPRGNTLVEHWAVSDGGKTLTITTSTPARGERPAMDVKRVYRRTGA